MFRNRTTFERTVLTRRYGFNNTGDNPQTGQNGGFNSTATASSRYVAGVAWVPDPPYRPPAPAPASGGGGGGGRNFFDRRPSRGGGGRKIICTKLYELGLLSKKIFQADQKFGKKFSKENPEVYWGYIAWAKTVVDWMEGKGPQCMFWIRDKKKRNKAQKELSIKWAKAIATPWAKHMAYLMGVEKKDNLAGKVIMTLGTPICKAVSKWQSIFGESRKPAGIIKGYSLWLLFAVFRLITLVIKK
jgi:hypothetical protein